MINETNIIDNDYLTCYFPETGLIPGYVIVSLKGAIYSLDQLDTQGRSTLMDTIANLHQTIKEVIDPERIYTLSIGEIQPRLHFHVFPRTKELLAKYKTQCSITEDTPISGMHLFEWAREYYKHEPLGNHTYINKKLASIVKT